MHNVNRPIDSKRDEYRKYLERTGVLQAVSHCLTRLYEETDKPNDAIGFVYKILGESQTAPESQKNIENELAEERAKVKQLTADLEAIQAKFAAFKKAEADAAKDEDAMLEDITDPAEPPSATVATPSAASVPSEAVATTDSAVPVVSTPSPVASVTAAAVDAAVAPSVTSDGPAPSVTPVESADVAMSVDAVSSVSDVPVSTEVASSVSTTTESV